MKKVLLSIIAIFTFSIANAQDELTVSPILSKKGENYLPQIDDWAISFNAENILNYIGNSFNGNTGNSLRELEGTRSNSFVGKKFISDKKAYRVVVNLGFNNNKTTSIATITIPTDPPTVVDRNREIKINDFDLALGLGKEWRKGNTRLQGFYGADVLLTANSNNRKTTFTDIDDNSFVESTEEKSGLSLGFGIQGFIGAEYFIFPKFAIGTQYTYRVGANIGGKNTTTSVDTANNSTTVENGSNTSFGLGNVGVAAITLSLYF